MKKLLSNLLILALVLGCASAMAEETGKVTLGTIDVNGAFTLQCGLPEGYTFESVNGTNQNPGQEANRPTDRVTVFFSNENDPTAPLMVLSVALDETYADVDRMNDLSEEDFRHLEETYLEMDPTVEISYGDTGLGTRLLIARQSTEEPNYIDFLSIYKGYFIEFIMTASPNAEDKTLSDDQMRSCIDFLTDLDFIPVGEPVIGSDPSSIAGLTYIADLSDYDAETNTVQAVLKRAVTLDPAYVAGLKVGDTLTIGDQNIVIESLEAHEEGDISINDEITLYQYGDDVHIYFYEQEYLEPFATLTLEVPEDLFFLDEVDPETGDILPDEAATRTAADFIALLTGSSENDPGFASENVYVTFDDNGEMAMVQRFYAPWQ